MTETTIAGPRPDTKDMLVGAFYADVLAFLHSHHTGEDEVVWPLLTARCGEAAAEVERIVLPLAAQHLPWRSGARCRRKA